MDLPAGQLRSSRGFAVGLCHPLVERCLALHRSSPRNADVPVAERLHKLQMSTHLARLGLFGAGALALGSGEGLLNHRVAVIFNIVAVAFCLGLVVVVCFLRSGL